jgi:lysophospholipase L1-like esterase
MINLYYDKIKKFLNHFLNEKVIFTIGLILISFWVFSAVFASPPGTPFLPSQNIIDPGCAEGSLNCYVDISTSIDSTDITGSTGGSIFFAKSGKISQDNSKLFWDDTTYRLGIGTDVPDTALHVVGSLKMVDGNEGAGKILTSDANGVASWSSSINNLSLKRANEIYTLGDSLTAAGTYQSNLVTSLGSPWNIINYGIGGTTTSQMLNRISSLTNGDANYSIVWGGINDVTGDISSATIESNLQSIYTSLHDAGSKVVALTISPFGASAAWTAPRQATLVAVNNWILNTATDVDYTLDIYSELEDSGNAGYLLPAYDSGDGLHLSTAGYNEVGTFVYNNVTFTVLSSELELKIGKNISLSQSLTPQDSPVFKSLTLSPYQNSTSGVIFLGANRFINTYGYQNTFIGVNAGNFSITGIDNTANGYNTLYSNTSGYANVAVGSQSLYSNTTGFLNTANGSQSLYSNTTGFANTANGYQSLYLNISGADNTANGVYSLYSNTTGYYNTANGFQSLYLNTTGGRNVAIGMYSLYSNTIASYNTANGFQSAYSTTTGSNNVALGYNSLYSNTTGSYNTAIGENALYTTTTVSNLVAMGDSALYSNTTGYDNTAFGSRALYTNNTGYQNTAVGSQALFSNTSGALNYAFGYQSLYRNTTGYYNTAFGYALFANVTGYENSAFGQAALLSSTSNGNSAFGVYSGRSITTGTFNTFIGHSSGYNASQKVDATNSTAIGRGAYTTKSNQMVFGNTSVIENLFSGNVGIGNTLASYALHVGSASVVDATVLLRLQDADSTCDFTANAGAPTCGSDVTLKKNVVDQTDNLTKILSLRPVTYNWLTDSDGINIKHGFIAQEVAEVMPELVTDGVWIDGSTKKFLQMSGMTPYMIGAIKELDLKITDINNFEKENSWRDSLISWFANAENRITRIFTGEVCLTSPGEEAVCLNRTELQSLKALLNSAPNPSPNPSPVPDPVPETCSDGIQNQDETGIDTGGICEPAPLP